MTLRAALSQRHASRSEELAHAIEPVLGARVVLRRDPAALIASNSRSSSFCRDGELDRRLDRDVAEQIAVRRCRAPALMPLLRRRNTCPVCVSGGNLDLGVAVERRDLDLAAERRGGEADRHLAMQVAALALEHRVRLQVDDDVEVAGRSAVEAGLAFAGQADAIVLVDARGNLDRQRLVLLDAPGAAGRSRTDRG